MSFFMKLLLCYLLVIVVYSSCPSDCSGHGTCKDGVCTCNSVTSTGWGSALNAGYTGTCPVGASVQTIPEIFRGTVYPHPIDGLRRLDEASATMSPTYTSKNIYRVKMEGMSNMGVEGGILRCNREDDNGYLGTANVLAYGENDVAIVQYNFNLTKATPLPSAVNDTEYTEEEEEYDFADYIANTVCSVFSVRNDLTQYKSITGEGATIKPWAGYAEMFTLMGWKNSESTEEETATPEASEQLKAACYKTKVTEKETKSYIIERDLTVTVGISDVEFQLSLKDGFTFNNYTVCYIMAYGNGDVIKDLQGTDLSKKLKYDGKWYYEIPEKDNPIVDTTGPTVSVKIPQENVDKIVQQLQQQATQGSTGGGSGDNADISTIVQPKVTFPLPTSPQEKAAVIEISMPGTPVTIDFGDAGKLPNTIIGVSPKDNSPPRRMLFEDERQLSFDYSMKDLDYVFADTFPGNGITDFQIEFNKVGGAHSPIECSGQGLCDRITGECKCYNGFTGEACQRMSCPSDCNNHGKCVSSLAAGYGAYGEMNGMIYYCQCDSGYRGVDCSLKECPSFVQTGVNDRDCSNHGLCDYLTGLCTCFAGYYGEGCQYTAGTV